MQRNDTFGNFRCAVFTPGYSARTMIDKSQLMMVPLSLGLGFPLTVVLRVAQPLKSSIHDLFS
jgi:hypothetical protein